MKSKIFNKSNKIGWIYDEEIKYKIPEEYKNINVKGFILKNYKKWNLKEYNFESNKWLF